MTVDPLTLELITNRLDEIVRQMQEAIFRTGYSTILRETKDTSAGICTSDGEIVGQNIWHPVHLGVFEPTIAAVLEYHDIGDMQAGDVFLMNDPYLGGTGHANDLVVARPVVYEGDVVSFTLNVAHATDLGGLVPGTSSGEAREVYHEGVQLPPVRVMAAGDRREDIFNTVRRNSRFPDVTIGDLEGQIGCTKIGADKLRRLFDEFGAATVLAGYDDLLGLASESARSQLEEWPTGTATSEIVFDAPADHDRWTDDLSPAELLTLSLSIENRGDRIVFDFTDSDDQSEYPINIQPDIVKAVCTYAVVGLADVDILNNSGLLDVCEVRTREGSILDPVRPAPVNMYGFTIVALTRVIIRAMNDFLGDRHIADDGGMMVLTFGSEEASEYEMLHSGYGGSSAGDGATGTSTHALNLRTNPIEIVETEFPNRVEAFEVIPDSEGPGQHRGSFGIRREYTTRDDVLFTFRPATSTVFPAEGTDGGQAADSGARCVLTEDGESRRLPTIANSQEVAEGGSILLEIYGGGGAGHPHDRPPEKVLRDYRDGFLTAERAAAVYGVIIDEDAEEISRIERD